MIPSGTREMTRDTAADVARARRQGLADLPARSARRHPDRTAVVDGGVRLTYARFDELIDRVAGALAAAGLTAGDRLGILSHNCWQFPVLTFATARIGVVLVPVNFMLTASEIAYILDHSGCVAFVAEDALVPTAEEAVALAGSDLALRGVIRLGAAQVGPQWTDVEEWCAYAGPPAPEVAVGDDDPIRLMYTSGTESRPKGALLTSRSLMWQYTSSIVAGSMESRDVEIHSMPFYHCAQLDNFFVPDVYLGATSIVLRSPDPAAILRAIEAEGATNLFCPPTVWISLLRSPVLDEVDVSTLTKGYYGASAMPAEILAEIRARFPNLRLWNFYGQTEMAPLATALPPEDQDDFAGSAGVPVLNVETRVVDPDGVELPAGEVGEIVHRSPHLVLGYHADPERTAEAFRDGWFHSGDLGYADPTGRLWVVDRKKDMIKTGGENVAGREVEEVLYTHEDLEEVAVFGIAHPHWVEAVVAAVVPRAGHTVTPDAVIAFCRARMAGYKTPKYVVVLDALPKNPSGKILKRSLRDTYADLAAAAR